VLFLPLDLRAEGLFALVLKEVGNGSHDKSSARTQGGDGSHLAPARELYPADPSLSGLASTCSTSSTVSPCSSMCSTLPPGSSIQMICCHTAASSCAWCHY